MRNKEQMRQPTAPEKISRRRGLWTSLPVFTLCLAMGVTLTPEAKAGFLDTYPLSSFTLVNSPSSVLTNGTAAMQGQSLVITGGNSGTGEPGTTTLTTTALANGQIAFLYSYSTLDSRGEDAAGYLINGLYVDLADATGASGEVQFNVTTGEKFGFEVTTEDNQFEPGILTISNVGSTTPEPATGPVVLLAIGAALIAVGVRSARSAKVETGA
jgi:hypothetical protein